MTRTNRRRAYALIIALALLPIFVILFGAMLNRVGVETTTARHAIMSLRAELLAEDALTLALHGAQPPAEGTRVVTDEERRQSEITVTRNGDGRIQLDATARIDAPPIGHVVRTARALIEPAPNAPSRILEYYIAPPPPPGE